MNQDLLNALIDDAIAINREIKEIEAGRLASLKSMLNVSKMKITDGLRTLSIKQAESSLGKVSLVESKGKAVLDQEAIMESLGVPSLDQFKKTGKPYEYLLINEL